LPYTVNFVADAVDFVASFGNKSATNRIWQFVAVDFVVDTVDSVASVYGALEADTLFLLRLRINISLLKIN